MLRNLSAALAFHLAVMAAASPLRPQQTPWQADSALSELPSSVVQHSLCPDGTKQLAGFLPGSPLFFTLAESRSDPATDPLAIWINGGPGSSSLVGMNTSGPCGIVRGKDGRPEMRRSETSWNAQANVLYIDNPRSVGFSKGEFPASHSSYTAAADFYAFLQAFLRAFPAYAAHDWAFNSGSYGGHYVPVFTGYILHQNARLAGQPSLYDDIFPDVSQLLDGHAAVHVPIKSVSIGNAWIRPRTQLRANVDFACGARAARDEGVPMLADNRTCAWAYEGMERCAALLETCSEEEMTEPRCIGAALYCDSISEIPYENTGRNPYNYLRKDTDDESALDEFYNSADVQVALGVIRKETQPVRWLAHNMKLHSEYTLSGDFNRRTDHLMERILRAGVDVLKYEGMVDWICNFIGIRIVMATLPGYKHQAKFNALEMTPWQPLKGNAGSYKCHQGRGEGKLCYLEILGAGHNIPSEKPREAQAMISSWVTNRTL